MKERKHEINANDNLKLLPMIQLTFSEYKVPSIMFMLCISFKCMMLENKDDIKQKEDGLENTELVYKKELHKFVFT